MLFLSQFFHELLPFAFTDCDGWQQSESMKQLAMVQFCNCHCIIEILPTLKPLEIHGGIISAI
jgi:hypothetical protein